MRTGPLVAFLPLIAATVGSGACAGPGEEVASSESSATVAAGTSALHLIGSFRPLEDPNEKAEFPEYVAAPLDLASAEAGLTAALSAAEGQGRLRAVAPAALEGTLPSGIPQLPLHDTYAEVDLVRHKDNFFFRFVPKDGTTVQRTAARHVLGLPPLTGHAFRARVVALAESELVSIGGAPDLDDDAAMQGAVERSRPRARRYQDAFATDYVNVPVQQNPWCNYFVSWLYDQAGKPLQNTGLGFSLVREMRRWLQESRQAVAVKDFRKVEPGDIVVIGSDMHTGIVKAVIPDGEALRIVTIEGNMLPTPTSNEGFLGTAEYVCRNERCAGARGRVSLFGHVR